MRVTPEMAEMVAQFVEMYVAVEAEARMSYRCPIEWCAAEPKHDCKGPRTHPDRMRQIGERKQ